MALPRLVKFVLSWSGAGETGQTGWYVQPQGPITHDTLQAAATYMAGNFGNGVAGAWSATLAKWLSTDQQFTQVSVYDYPAGKSPAGDQAIATIPAAKGKGTGLMSLSLQSAACVSLHTGRPGASYRGRMYLPATGMGLTSHRFAATDLDDLAMKIGGRDDAVASNDIWGLLADSERSLAAVGTGSTGAGTCVVRSVTKGLVSPVTTVSIDDKPDTQRRRAKSATIVYKANNALLRPT